MPNLETRGELPKMGESTMHAMDHITTDPVRYIRILTKDAAISPTVAESMLMPFLYQDCERQAVIVAEALRTGDDELVTKLSYAAAQSKKDDTGFSEVVSRAVENGQDQLVQAATLIIVASAFIERGEPVQE